MDSDSGLRYDLICRMNRYVAESGNAEAIAEWDKTRVFSFNNPFDEKGRKNIATHPEEFANLFMLFEKVSKMIRQE